MAINGQGGHKGAGAAQKWPERGRGGKGAKKENKNLEPVFLC